MKSQPSSPEGVELKPDRIANGDPFLKMLARINASPILVGVAYPIMFQLVRALAAWRAGHLRTTGTITGFLDSPGPYVQLIGAAAIWAYYTWMPRGIVTLFKGLDDNGVIGDPIPTLDDKEEKRTYASFVGEMQALFGKWWWSGLSLATAVSGVLILVLPEYLDPFYATAVADIADNLSLMLSVLWVGTALYAVMLMLVYGVLTIYWLRRLFKSFTINVRPLHPDRAGGLSPLGNFSLMLSYIISLLGVMLVTVPVIRNYVVVGTLEFRWSTELVLGLGIYLVAAPTVFFTPLSVAHSAMQDAKDQLLLQIARRFDREYVSVRDVLGASDDAISGLENDLSIMKELQTLHDTISEFPVWPFNTANIRRFATSYLLPIAIPFLIELVVRLIAK